MIPFLQCRSDFSLCVEDAVWGCSNSPKGCAVKMNHHPFGRVKNKGVRKFNAFQRPAELGTEVGGAGVCSIHVKPEGLLFTCVKVKAGSGMS